MIPILFAIQQFIEGMIWLSFDSKWLPVLTNIYGIFSHILWPFFVPLAVYLVEPDKYRKRMHLGLLILGTILSAFIAYFIIKNPLTASIAESSIQYEYIGAYPYQTLGLYLLVVTMAPLFSSFRMIKVFGVALFLSALVAYQSYEFAFFSVWCFFAAVLSIIILLYFTLAKKSKVPAVFDLVKKKVSKN